MTLKETTNTIPAALLKGAAANLAIQALGKNLNKKNILPTLAIGALGGGLSCLTDDKYFSTLIAASVFGGGNSLANKASFPRTMFKYALIGTAGRLMLNVPEAVARQTKDRWKIIYDFKLPGGILPRVKQKSESEGCSHAVLMSIAQYLGYNDTFINNIKKEMINIPDETGVDFENLATSKGLITNPIAHNLQHIGAELFKNHPAVVTYKPSFYPKMHTVAIERIEWQQNINNPQKRRFIIHTMNPLFGSSDTMTESEFNTGKVVIVKQ